MRQPLINYLKKHGQGTIELVQSMQNYLFIINLKGEILLVSDSVFENTEIDKKTIYGTQYSDYFMNKDRSCLNMHDLLLLNNDLKTKDIFLNDNSADGPIEALIVSSAILKSFFEDQDYILLLIADMREQKQHQMQMMYANKMVALGEMASAIAHEINNPLLVVNGQTKMLAKLLQDPEKNIEKLRKTSDKISTNVDRISKIIGSLRTISRSCDDNSFSEVPFSSIKQSLIDLTHEKIHSSKIDFTVQGGKDETILKCREPEILQVLVNLVKNSIDSLQGSTSPWIKILIAENDQYIAISVIDCGAGITFEQQVRLFEPFYTTKSIGQGTGLGLSISKSLVEAHNGTLEYIETHKNTCFRVCLPKNPSE